jgi:IclR family KDG regulon transcriptional repressor
MLNSESTNTVLRAFKVIQSFSITEPELGPSEISRKTGLPVSTVHRLLKTMKEAHVLEIDSNKGKYRIGPTLYVIGNLYIQSTDILKVAEPVMETLNDLTNETVNLGILDKGYMTLIMKKESKEAFRYAIRVGTVMPAYASAIGKALLSELTEEDIDRLYPHENLKPITEKTIPTRKALKKELIDIRNCGISLDYEGSYRNVIGIASVIRNNMGEAVAGMSITPPIYEVNEEKKERLIRLVLLGCSLISYKLGYSDNRNRVSDIDELVTRWHSQRLSQ